MVKLVLQIVTTEYNVDGTDNFVGKMASNKDDPMDRQI